jgi:hypothetical protein
MAIPIGANELGAAPIQHSSALTIMMSWRSTPGTLDLHWTSHGKVM